MGHGYLRDRIQELISLVGLEAAADMRPISAYSSGMKQRLALARISLARHPMCLSWMNRHEHRSGRLRGACISLIWAICIDSRKTLLIATHRQER